MTRDVDAQPAPRPIHRLVLAFCILVGLAFPLCTPNSSVVHAGPLVYDEPVLARAEAQPLGYAGASPGLLGAVYEVPASWPAKAPGASTTSGSRSVATNTVDDFVDLASPARRTHILDGDATGGGHLWPGNAGKSPFPQGWTGDKIMNEISDIATDPVAWQNAVPQGSRTVLTGTRGGVDIRVVVDTKSGEIITGYPTNLPRNP